jgi:hypothetical protein
LHASLLLYLAPPPFIVGRMKARSEEQDREAVDGRGGWSDARVHHAATVHPRREKEMRLRLFALVAVFAPLTAFAQQSDDLLVSTARDWGGAGGVYTCEQWRAYVTRLYRLADPRGRGYIEATDFEIIKKTSAVFREATFDYFDMAGKGRVTKQEFIEFESPFFARFDKKHRRRVTHDDIRQANAPAPQTPMQRAGSGGRGGPGGGGLGGGFGWR